MKYNLLGKAGIKVSRLSFGASSLGSVFRPVAESEAIQAVHAALECGINYFDVAPAYGGTLSETILGKALRGVPRDRYYLSTKVGKYTLPGNYGENTLDYSRARIRASIEESSKRLGTDYFDLIHIHDIEYQGRKHTEWALGEGFESVMELKKEGRIGSVSFGIYPMDLWMRIQSRRIGIINGSPFASGLLTNRGPADWHPAAPEDRAIFRAAAEFCNTQGVSIAQLALQFASQNPDIPTTLFSSADPESVRRNVQWHEQPYDSALLAQVQKIIESVNNKQWIYD
jgi:L-galactose dehydrogenase